MEIEYIVLIITVGLVFASIVTPRDKEPHDLIVTLSMFWGAALLMVYFYIWFAEMT